MGILQKLNDNPETLYKLGLNGKSGGKVPNMALNGYYSGGMVSSFGISEKPDYTGWDGQWEFFGSGGYAKKRKMYFQGGEVSTEAGMEVESGPQVVYNIGTVLTHEEYYRDPLDL